MSTSMTLAKINKLFCIHMRKQHGWSYLVKSINRGDCYKWAYIVHKLLGAELCSLPGHAFVKMYGRYYEEVLLIGNVCLL